MATLLRDRHVFEREPWLRSRVDDPDAPMMPTGCDSVISVASS
jgi:hypothetical protein